MWGENDLQKALENWNELTKKLDWNAYRIKSIRFLLLFRHRGLSKVPCAPVEADLFVFAKTPIFVSGHY